MSKVNESTVLRKSAYPMTEMDIALDLVMRNGSGNLCGTSSMKLTDALGYIIAEDVYAPENFPPFRTSIMDGYAVVAPLTAGQFNIHNAVLAGDAVPEEEANLQVASNTVAYITTGSRVPDWANAVVKVEDTSNSNVANTVNINIDVHKVNENIRLIGSDIKLNECIVNRGAKITAIEIALLATVGRVSVNCYNYPTVGVISTGNELVEYDAPSPADGTSKIRDTNRLAIIAALQSENNLVMNKHIVDYGITPDNNEELVKIFEKAINDCDVVITSGGVSMGAADLVKPMLEKLGTVHFGRLNMKPGKPTTFATVEKTGKNKCFLFGLPGNPVSCLVCKSLIVDPLIDLLKKGGVVDNKDASPAALSKQELVLSQHDTPQYSHEVNVTLQDLSVKMDAERPEYHRCVVVYDTATSTYHAYSTGIQQSSRMLSLRAANALLIVPSGKGVLSKGAVLRCVLLSLPHSITTGTTIHAAEPAVIASSLPEHQYDNFGSCPCCVNSAPGVSQYYNQIKTNTNAKTISSSVTNAAPPSGHTSNSMVSSTKMVMKVGVLTVSDRASDGTYEDKSGFEIINLLQKMCETPNYPLEVLIRHKAVVPDEKESIQSIVHKWCDEEGLNVDLILTSGGTGFGARDFTPEAIRPLFHREAPSIAQALIQEGLKHTPLALLSRPVVGVRNDTLIATLPGSVKAVRENIVVLTPLLPRIMELLIKNTCGGQ